MSDLGNKKIMAENIRYYLRVNGILQTEICSVLGLKMPTFSDWVNAKTYPRIDKIEMMANYFGISKADLVEKRSGPSNETRPNSELHKLIDSLPFDKLDEAKNYLGYLKAKSDNS